MLKRDAREIARTTFIVEGLGKVGGQLTKMIIRGGGEVKAYDPWHGAFDPVQQRLSLEFKLKNIKYILLYQMYMYLVCARCNIEHEDIEYVKSRLYLRFGK